MGKGRLEAFSDGVIAVIITIMVLELKAPQGSDARALVPIAPTFLVYALSFANVGLFWNNHHHMFMAAKRVDGRVLWANLHLLFWLSLVPFTTNWIGESHFAATPASLYGVVLLMSGIAYMNLERELVKIPENISLAAAIGNDTKAKLSAASAFLGIPLAYVSPWISIALYVMVALVWTVPDRRIESRIAGDGSATKAENPAPEPHS